MGPAGGGIEENRIKPLGGFAGFFALDEGRTVTFRHSLIDDHLLHVVAGGNFIHKVEHHTFEKTAESASSRAFFDGRLSEATEGIACEIELNPLHPKKLGILAGE